jgi:hypothetical protein
LQLPQAATSFSIKSSDPTSLEISHAGLKTVN